jgi:hypothetical protein
MSTCCGYQYALSLEIVLIGEEREKSCSKYHILYPHEKKEQ